MKSYNKKAKIEFTARIIDPEGNIVEKTMTSYKDIPAMSEFDCSSMEGFQEDFGLLEQAVLEARNDIGKGITEEYMMDMTSKKNAQRTTQKD